MISNINMSCFYQLFAHRGGGCTLKPGRTFLISPERLETLTVLTKFPQKHFARSLSAKGHLFLLESTPDFHIIFHSKSFIPTGTVYKLQP